MSLNDAKIHRVPVHFREIFGALEIEFSRKFPKNVLVVTVGDIPSILADYKQVYQLFYHLLENVIHYGKPGETAHVSIQATVLKQNRYKTTSGKYDYIDFLQITLTDQGIGFDPHYKHQIFDLFNKLHHLNHSGLGLSYCKLIVENHGGFIEADSKPSEGTRITLHLPLFQPGELAADVPALA